MKKHILAVAVATVLTSSVWAATPTTVLEKTNAMEVIVYGQAQEGALVDRVDQLSETVYGAQRNGDLNAKVDSLYTSIEGSNLSLKEQMDFVEWKYMGKTTNESLTSRLEKLERSLNGRVATGSLATRLENVKKVVLGKEAAISTQSGTLESSHVFKVLLQTPINSNTSKVGDKVSFTVADDIVEGNTLMVPAGTKGEGHITEVKKAASFGRNAKLNIAFDTIPAFGGSTFSAVQGKEAQAKTKSELKAAGASVAGAVLLGPVGLVGGFFVKGKTIELPAGSEIYVQPTEAVTLQGLTTGTPLGNVKESTVPAQVELTTTPTTTDHATVETHEATHEATTTASTETGERNIRVVKYTEPTATATVHAPTVTTTDSSATVTAPDKPIVVVKRQ